MISFDLRDCIALIRLNCPEKLNALTGAMLADLSETFERVKREPAIRALVLTGAGDGTFSAGVGSTELATINAEEARDVSRRVERVCALIEDCGVPVIAAINGLAAGEGCELALACHLRIASADARFSLPEARLGVIPASGTTQRLARALGSGRAIELMLTGAPISADEALRMGLINRVVRQAQLLPEAEALAREISQLAPLAIRACLEAVTQGLDLPLAEGLELETKLFSSLFNTEDMREGIGAFLEKRAPAFRGK